jgi:Bacteriophage T4, Gp8
MVAIIKNKFRLQNAKEFLTNFSVNVTDKNYYLFVGKPLPWRAPEGQQGSSTITATNADLYPPLPEDTQFSENRIWDEMLGLKKIGASDVSLVIPRSDYKSGTIYAVFDDNDAQLHQRPSLEDVQKARAVSASAGTFYALNSNNELFVCISNNSGQPSTQEPTRPGIVTDLVVLSDNYIWKYITSITSGDAVKFLTDSWIPVKTLSSDNGTGQYEVQSAATPGELLCVVVKNTTESSETATTFPHTYAGAITVSGNLTATVNTSPSQVANAYVNYQLHVTTNGTTKVFDINSYDSSTNILTVASAKSLASEGLTTGTTYSSCKILPKISVYSNGTSVPVCVPVVDESTHLLVEISVTDRGENATFVSIDVTKPVADTSVLPTVRPILSSLNGLGKDPEKDLGAFYVMVSTQIKYNEGEDQDGITSQPHLSDFPVKNDYRQIGILQNARQNTGASSSPLCTSNTLRATKRIKVQFDSESTLGITGDPGFKSDEEIDLRDSSDNSIGKLKAIDFKFFNRDSQTDAYIGEITFVQTPDTKYQAVAVAHRVVGTYSGAQASVIEVIDEELKKFDGEILYIENRRPVIRSVDQIEDLKTIIEF